MLGHGLDVRVNVARSFSCSRSGCLRAAQGKLSFRRLACIAAARVSARPENAVGGARNP